MICYTNDRIVVKRSFEYSAKMNPMGVKPRANSETRPDRRRAHGVRTRREILDAALRMATREGLESLTIGRLATDAGMSKAGLFGHFGSKEALQIATIDAAWEVYQREVIEPTAAEASGALQLRSFMENYFGYVKRHAAQGGCFFTAVSSEFDDREGPVRERVREVIAERNGLVDRVLHAAIEAGHLSKMTDVPQMSFEILSLVSGANLIFQLTKDPAIFDRARVALQRLTPPQRRKPRGNTMKS